jgi:hypothetical protein
LEDIELADKKTNQNSLLSLGLIIGAGIGLLIGMVAGNLAIGIAIGAGVGLMFGVVIGRSAADREK